MSKRATVLIPTMAGRGPTLEAALPTVLAQSVTDIEVFILGDGVDAETRAIITGFAAADDRIRFFDHPKHRSRGEPNRHAALQEATGRVVCYLCDRDLMLPNHVETVEALLTDSDFCYTLPLRVHPVRGIEPFKSVDVTNPDDRRWMARTWHPENGIPLSFAAHSLDAYRRLPHGWRITPKGQFTDIYMWQQFLSQRWCRAAMGYAPTILYFPRYCRDDWDIERKRQELIGWLEHMTAPSWDREFLATTTEVLARTQLKLAGSLRRTTAARPATSR